MNLLEPHTVKTLADMECFLMSWLKPCNEQEKNTVTYQGKLFTQCMGFRRAFNIHGLYYNIDTNEFAFHVDEDTWHQDYPPNFGIHKSFTECIRSVAEKYMVAWNLTPGKFRNESFPPLKLFASKS